LKKIELIGVTVGNTPMIQLTDRLYAKLETYNPSGSIKDRLIYYLLRDAIAAKEITHETRLIEATSGNTGISLSLFGAYLGLDTTIIMPSNMSEERKIMMKSYGANVLEVCPSDFSGAIKLRDEMCKKDNKLWSPKQFSNLKNICCHMETTAEEIYRSVGSQWSAFVSGAGTGGTMMGIQTYIKQQSLPVETILMTPLEDSHTHGIQGVNDGADFLLNKEIVSHEIKISTPEAIDRAKRLARETGLLVGISSGANVLAAERYIERENPSGIVVTILCDRGERYTSIFNQYVPVQNR
jgi:cysteine synthase A